jgi:hypothetical protein
MQDAGEWVRATVVGRPAGFAPAHESTRPPAVTIVTTRSAARTAALRNAGRESFF